MKKNRKKILKKIVVAKLIVSCNRCGAAAPRHSIKRKILIGLDCVSYEITTSMHRCHKCRAFQVVKSPVCHKSKSRYANEVHDAAMDLFDRGDMTIEQIEMHLLRCHGVRVPGSTLGDWKNRELREQIRSESERWRQQNGATFRRNRTKVARKKRCIHSR